MDLRAHSFRCFLVLAEELSFTRAAERAGMTQSALSMRIRDMEQQLGLALFHRSSRAVTLTGAGTELVDQARRIVAEADRFQQLCGQLREAPEAPLTVAMPLTGVGNDRWMAVIDRFRALEPDVMVRLSRHATPDVLAAVVSGRADIGFVAGIPADKLPTVVLARERIELAVPEEWPLASAPAMRLTDLANMRVAGFDPAVNPGLHAECFDPLTRCGVQLVPAPEGIIGSGFAGRERLATLVFPGMRRDLTTLQLRCVPVIDLALEVSLCAVHAPGNTRRAVRRFWTMLNGSGALAAQESADSHSS